MQVPTVSVVIPTIGRPSLATAVESVLRQTALPLEIVICNDGYDDLDFSDVPLARVINVGPRKGGNHARRSGIEAASGELIALLDDDDYWEPEHLKMLLNMVYSRSTETSFWVASSCGLVGGQKQYPARLKSADESLASYMFRLKFPNGKGALSTSTLLFPREIAMHVPWRRDLRYHQDLTWLLDLDMAYPGLEVLQKDAVTVVFGDTPGSVSKSIGVHNSVEWAKQEILCSGTNRRREFADFLLTRYPIRAAAFAGDTRASWYVFRAAFRHGKPSLPGLLYSIGVTGLSLAKRSRTLSRFSSSPKSELQ